MYKAGKNPTRAGYMAALLSMNTTNRFAASGRRCMKTQKTDHFIISQMQLQRFNAAPELWAPHRPARSRVARAKSFSLHVTGSRGRETGLYYVYASSASARYCSQYRSIVVWR